MRLTALGSLFFLVHTSGCINLTSLLPVMILRLLYKFYYSFTFVWCKSSIFAHYLLLTPNLSIVEEHKSMSINGLVYHFCHVQWNVVLLWWQCLRSLDMPEKRKQADAVRKRLGKWRAGLENDPFSQQVLEQLLWLFFLDLPYPLLSPYLIKYSSWSSYSVRWNGGPDLAPCLFDQIHRLSCSIALGTSKFFKAWFTPIYLTFTASNSPIIPCWSDILLTIEDRHCQRVIGTWHATMLVIYV